MARERTAAIFSILDSVTQVNDLVATDTVKLLYSSTVFFNSATGSLPTPTRAHWKSFKAKRKLAEKSQQFVTVHHGNSSITVRQDAVRSTLPSCSN